MSDLDYELPPDLVAQQPTRERDSARMLVLDRAARSIRHAAVSDLPRLLRPNDILVLNDTKVFPARVYGRRLDTGGRIEILFVEEMPDGTWSAMARARGRLRSGCELSLALGAIRATVIEVAAGRIRLKLASNRPLLELLDQHGLPPLPPYIRRPRSHHAPDETRSLDLTWYQTVYAREVGAVAAPTAGLHFSTTLLDAIEQVGVKRVHITLHVGPGTFRMIMADDAAEHTMEPERYSVPAATADAIANARAAGGRVVAVGTTVVRSLETVASACDGIVTAREGRTSLFIYPPFQFRVVDAMLTNFHLPRSTPLLMVAAFAGQDLVREAYAEAVRQRYRFYSYGDCMLIL